MKLKIKICGLRETNNILQAAELNPDMMGFIFFSKSPRYAGNIGDSRIIGNLPETILKTGVFVNEPEDSIIKTADRYSLDAIQLHGDESPLFCCQIRARGLKVIKAFRINAADHFKDCRAYTDCTDFFLFDTLSETYGGSGKKFDWKILESYSLHHPFLVSGGISPDDAEDILSIKNPYFLGVDLNSRFESKPAIKDIYSLERFISKIRQNDYTL